MGYFPYQLLIINIFFSQFQVKEARNFKWATCYNIVSMQRNRYFLATQ